MHDKEMATGAEPCGFPRERLALRADWHRLLFIQYEVDPAALQPLVPFELDLWEGRAYVSAVPFFMKRLRPTAGGLLTRALFSPIATHELLNVRTYVRQGPERAVYFMSEWNPNALSCWLGPRTYGLPYRRGRFHLEHRPESGRLAGLVAAREGGGRFCYEAEAPPGENYRPAAAGSLTEFLLERYAALTAQGRRRNLFRVQHPPWLLADAKVTVLEDSLLASTGDWSQTARRVGAVYSPGFSDVWMSRPLPLDAA